MVIRSFAVTPTVQRRRLDQRWSTTADETWPVSEQDMATWAAAMEPPTTTELDGSEPIGDPPRGYATWSEWRTHRRPRSVE